MSNQTFNTDELMRSIFADLAGMGLELPTEEEHQAAVESVKRDMNKFMPTRLHEEVKVNDIMEVRKELGVEESVKNDLKRTKRKHDIINMKDIMEVRKEL